ncbi:MAG: DMT family transporter [Hydrogenophaga sp.]|jgi:drug/metabolite transporter (DMT)-like permease|uniref:DMT family transporter n=1 Tax=Hydrogenophaga sp. TaxID=1904254 RepID=UPI00276E3DDE|nr:DMT family transporter [Hydrogenophaga sp.]MDP2419002.1 DMT family transporter [Hydrogenophaga sp.]MDZ4188537.1 DMT family transporter [Hydrogenophaga sp.]
MSANLLALGAIALWASLAALGVALSHVPPFLLTGLALLVGSVIALPLSRFDLRQWRVPLSTLAMGIYGLFGFHFLLFVALRHAPPVQANLVNYLWPLGIVVMAPLFLPGVSLTARHVLAALLGFAGAALAILGGRGGSSDAVWAWGYIPALGSAFIWASYSLLTKRVRTFPTAAIGSFALVSGLLSLLCHAWLEPATALSARDWGLIVVMGLGPLGGAFFLWDAALKRGDARQIGVLSFLTPLLSTLTLLWVRGETPSVSVALAAVMIIGAAMMATRGR